MSAEERRRRKGRGSEKGMRDLHGILHEEVDKRGEELLANRNCDDLRERDKHIA